MVGRTVWEQEVIELLGLKPSADGKSGTKQNETQQYRRYIAARGIKSTHNTYDVSLTLNPYYVGDGLVVGQIVYLDGTKKPIVFNDTGMNDDVVYEFCCDRFDRSKKKKITWGEMKLIAAEREKRNARMRLMERRNII